MEPVVEKVALYESPLSQSSEVFVSCLLVATGELFSLVLHWTWFRESQLLGLGLCTDMRAAAN